MNPGQSDPSTTLGDYSYKVKALLQEASIGCHDCALLRRALGCYQTMDTDNFWVSLEKVKVGEIRVDIDVSG
jgi:hypothetical protein